MLNLRRSQPMFELAEDAESHPYYLKVDMTKGLLHNQ